MPGGPKTELHITRSLVIDPSGLIKKGLLLFLLSARLGVNEHRR